MKSIIMIGPNLEGTGGISRVASIWKETGFFSEHCIKYISSTNGISKVTKTFNMLRGLFLLLCRVRNCRLVYIHTACYTSFYRKSLFILTALLFRIPILLHIHPTEFIDFIDRAMRIEKTYIYFLLRRVKYFVVLTNEMKNKIEAMQLGKAVFILPNPINLQELSQEPKPRRNNRFLYLGWYIKEKGVYDLVDAAEILLSKGINIKIDFFGTVQEGKLREYVETKRLAHAISVNGWINGKGKIDKLLTCTGLVLPSYTEGIPNVILEAMATKTPIISTLVGGLKEVLRDGENAIIVKPGNPADLSEKMKQCLEDEGLRKKIALQGYQEAKTKYDVRVIRQQFGNIVAQVLS